MNRSFYCLLLFFLGFLAFHFTKSAFADSGIVINEALVHPSTGNKEWVELYTSGTDVTNYWLDDDTDFVSDTGGSSKKQISNPIVGADIHHVVFELSSSMFNNDGDTIALFSPDGQLVDSYQYTKDPGVDISIGRTPDVSGDFSVLSSATRGSANSISKPTVTPTPEPTAKPTKEPKATKMPSSSSTKSDTSDSRDASFVGGDVAASNNETSYDTPDGSTASLEARPTSILGIATKAAEKKRSKPLPTVMVKGTTHDVMPLVLTSFGGLFLLSCGILIYLKKKGII